MRRKDLKLRGGILRTPRQYGFCRKADSTDSAGRADAPGCAGTARTAEIGRQIAEIDDDREFLRYLSGHCCSREQQYRTARAEIIRLMDRCGKDTASGLHEEVMGFRYQDTLLARQKRQKLLPKEFTRSLPTDRTFLDIRKGKKETYETMRKTLIILLFYDFYHAAREAAEEPDDDTVRSNAEDFYQEANEVLARCGMPLLYERHPFDRLMLFCALKKSPLDAFYGLNDRKIFGGMNRKPGRGKAAERWKKRRNPFLSEERQNRYTLIVSEGRNR